MLQCSIIEPSREPRVDTIVEFISNRVWIIFVEKLSLLGLYHRNSPRDDNVCQDFDIPPCARIRCSLIQASDNIHFGLKLFALLLYFLNFRNMTHP